MVATRGTDQIVDFITGKSRIDPATIRVEHWVEIIRAVISELPMNYLRGLRPVNLILQHGEMEYNGYTVDLKRVPVPLPQIFVTTLDRGTNPLRRNDVFLNCAEVGDFPAGQFASERWKKAIQGAVDGKVPVLYISNYLLSRDKKLFYMLTEWTPHERWGDRDWPDEFWYEAKVTIFEELDDKRLDAYLANGPERNVAKRMLHRLHYALGQTAEDIRGQYDHVREKEHLIGGYLDRFGELDR